MSGVVMGRAMQEHYFYNPDELCSFFPSDDPELWQWVDLTVNLNRVRGYIRRGRTRVAAGRFAIKMASTETYLIVFATRGAVQWHVEDMWVPKMTAMRCVKTMD